MHNYRSLIRKPRERRQCKHNARTKLPPAATKCKCTTTGHCFNLQVQHATMPSTTGALRSSCVLTSKCDTGLQAETRCHDAVEPLLFPALLHLQHPTHCHHKTTIILQHRTMWQTFKFGHKNNSCQNTFFGWTKPPWRVPRLSSTSCAALLQAANSRSRRNVSSHHPQQPELEADELTFPTKNDWATPCPVKQLQGEVLPIWQPMPRPPTACDTLPPQNNNHPATLHHVTNMQLSSQSYSAPPDLHAWCQDIQQSSAQLSNRKPLVVRSTANIPSMCHFAKLHYRNFCQGILEPFTTPGHSTATQLLQPNFHGLVHLQHPTHCHHKTTIILQHCTMWQTCNFRHNPILPHRTCMRGAKTSSNRARSSPTASHLLSGPRPTFRACAILRSSITEICARASWSHSRPLVTALLRSSCNRISTASDDADDAVACSIRTDIPFSKWNSDHKTSTNVTGAWLQPNLLHSEISRHAYLFACFKTMPWHAWFQNKIERYKIERYNDSRSIFLSTAHAFQWKHHIYFFRAIHHIDPLHRKQTLTLSQCNSRDLTDSPYRNLEKCKKCSRYLFANRHLFREHSAYI